jgi:hypothetical protein
MKKLKAAITNVTSAVGGIAIVLGELDDSPGLGGIGMIIIGVSIWLNVKNTAK